MLYIAFAVYKSDFEPVLIISGLIIPKLIISIAVYIHTINKNKIVIFSNIPFQTIGLSVLKAIKSTV